jgi:hypothetical protein
MLSFLLNSIRIVLGPVSAYVAMHPSSVVLFFENMNQVAHVAASCLWLIIFLKESL